MEPSEDRLPCGAANDSTLEIRPFHFSNLGLRLPPKGSENNVKGTLDDLTKKKK